MEETSERHVEIEGNLIAELLDLQEYPSNVGEVAAVSDEQIMVLRRDRNELVGFTLQPEEMARCRSIEYQRETSWLRILVGAACFVGVGVFVIMMVMSVGNFVEKATPLIIGAIACTSFGVRMVTSTHRHVIRFEMPDEVLTWRSPAIDYDSKAEAAHDVRVFARSRGILKQA